VLDAVRTYLGSALGPMRGRDGNVHRGRPREGCLPMISHLGAMISVVNGALMARRFKKLKARGRGLHRRRRHFHRRFSRGLNQAAVERLPWCSSWPIINTPIPRPTSANLPAMI
jgi:acetoin:2,6-dichlorophenolindophenol oxidoreductase subunit alpha